MESVSRRPARARRRGANSGCAPDYAGREQAYVKHVFLESYLEALVHKTASTYADIVYRRWLCGPLAERQRALRRHVIRDCLNALRAARSPGSGRARREDVGLSGGRDTDAYASWRPSSRVSRYLEIKTYRPISVGLCRTLLRDIPGGVRLLPHRSERLAHSAAAARKPLLARAKLRSGFQLHVRFHQPRRQH